MKLAFLHKNFSSLSLEHKVICLVHGATLLLAFFPWYSETPAYGDALWRTAFQGPSFLIGTSIFLLSLLVIIYFVDILWERKKFNIRLPIDPIFLAIGAQQLLLIVLAWSVLEHTASQSYSAEIRFGVFLVFLLQFAGLISSILSIKGNRKQQVRTFFQHPESNPSQEKKGEHKNTAKEQSLL